MMSIYEQGAECLFYKSETHFTVVVPTRLATRFHTGILIGLFEPEEGDSMFLRNVEWLSTDYTALYPRIQ
jgi:hypothetical protein